MILTGPEIERRLAAGEIEIEPRGGLKFGPNSVDLTLADRVLVYDAPTRGGVLDPRRENLTRELRIPPGGLELTPGVLYLGSTVERTNCGDLVPWVEGRSSVGRLGLFVHVTAGFGDIGFNSTWTLELTCVHRVRVHPGMRVCQLVLAESVGEVRPYRGKYQHQAGPVASRLHLDAEGGA